MALIVQKFGGTSVGTLEKISHVADKVIAAKEAGDDLVVVLSAMSGQTDKLTKMAFDLSDEPVGREFDALLSTGEQVTVALLCIALDKKGYSCVSYNGSQLPVHTNEVHTKARILDIDVSKVKQDLADNKIVVVTGFQGVNKYGDITTLGRGGSDTSAVAIAAKLAADECQIYTDVDGVYTTDPRVVSSARRLDRVSFEEMLELASLGAKVLQLRAVEFAGKHRVPLRVLSTFEEGEGTLITLEDNIMERPVLAGIAFNRDEAKLSIVGIPDSPGVAAKVLGPVSDNNIDVDVIVQNIGEDGKINLSFTVNRSDYKQAYGLLEGIANDIGASGISGDDKTAKVSLVGVGMRSHPGIASNMFTALGEEGVSIKLISTSEIKVSVIVDEKYLELAVRALHTAFGLDEESRG